MAKGVDVYDTSREYVRVCEWEWCESAESVSAPSAAAPPMEKLVWRAGGEVVVIFAPEVRLVAGECEEEALDGGFVSFEEGGIATALLVRCC